MDPLSISASTAALLHIVHKIYEYVKDFKDAPEERAKFIEGLQSVEAYLEQLLRLSEAAQSAKKTDDRWFQGLLRQVDESGSMTPDGRFNWMSDMKPNAPMTRLHVNLEKMLETSSAPKVMALDPTPVMMLSHLKATAMDHFRATEVGQRALWHWDKEKYRSFLDEIVRARDDLDSIIHLDQAAMVLNINSNVEDAGVKLDDLKRLLLEDQDEKRRQREDSDRDAIQQWLTPLNFRDRLATILDSCFETRWLEETEQFRHWVLGQSWYLTCYGDPGCGKTGLSALVIHHLQAKYQTPNTPVLYLFLDSRASSDQTPVELFASLLKQLLLLSDSGPPPSTLKNLWGKAKSRKPLLNEVYSIFQTELQGYSMAYLVVDALDECSCRGELMTRLLKLRRSWPRKLNLMVTTRRDDVEDAATEIYCDICQKNGLQIYFHCSICDDGELDLCENCITTKNRCTEQFHKLKPKCLPVEVRTPSDELKRYVKLQIEEAEDDGSDSWDERIYHSNPNSSKFRRRLKKHPELLDKIPSVVVRKADGRFLWVKLYMDSLTAKQNYKQIKEALDNDPDVDALYEETMQRICAQKDEEDRDLGLKTLSLMARAQRNLSLAELLQALAIEPGTNDIDEDKDFDKEGILRTTAGLISIDSDAGAVRCHSTFQVYLAGVSDKWFPNSELSMANICVTLLSFKTFSQPCKSDEELDAKKRKYPFLAYASQYWGDHVREAGISPSSEMGALQLVKDESRVAAYIEAAYSTDRGSAGWDVRLGIEGLHVCAWFGLSLFISALEQEDEEDFEVDVLDRTYRQTPLMYACRRGNVEVVRELLDRGASVALPSARGRTALMEAVLMEQQEVVDLLLEASLEGRVINAVNSKDYNSTALMLAARRGCSGISAALLAHPDIQINQQDLYGRTALSVAAIKGFVDVVEALLKKSGINTDLAESIAKRSPLILAAQRDNCGVVELLLQHGADPGFQDDRGGTAMLRATEAGHISVLKTMISHDVRIECTDEDGRSLLHSASEGGYLDIIRLLYKRNPNLNARDTNKLTPLHEASRAGKSESTRILLELGADRTLRDIFDRTPFTVAWQHGNVQIMRILEDDDSNSTQQDSSTSVPDAGKLPAWSLAKLGLSDLLQGKPRKAFLSEVEPGSGNTALHWAVLASNLDIVRVLLQDYHMDPDGVNRYKRTALHLAALDGNMSIIADLIRSNASLDELDRWETAPLFLAQNNKRFPAALALIEAGASIDSRKIDVQTMFFSAIELKRAKAVEILLGSGADVFAKQDGVPALEFAKNIGDMEVLHILRSKVDERRAAP
ncbi:hypothetical protein MMC13_001825 [Lambiella insularis]|nr:hypothetical protein [Lambiella insularis]